MANKYFVLGNPDMAEEITSYGRYSLKTTTDYTIKEINGKLGKDSVTLAQQDTDSLMISFANVLHKRFGVENTNKRASDEIIQSFRDGVLEVEAEVATEFLLQFIEKVVEPKLNESSKINFELFNCHQPRLVLDIEVLADRMVSTGKKRYYMRKVMEDGRILAKPKYKITGLEIKRSSTPSIVRKKFEEALDYFIDNTNSELKEFIDEFHAEYRNVPLDEIATPTGIKDIEKYQNITKSVPIHVRAAKNYNKYINDHGLTDSYQEVFNDDKIKFVYLRMPNPIMENVIAWNNSKFMSETGLINYVDYETQFEKTFISPLETICEVIGWNINGENVVDDLF